MQIDLQCGEVMGGWRNTHEKRKGERKRNCKVRGYTCKENINDGRCFKGSLGLVHEGGVVSMSSGKERVHEARLQSLVGVTAY